MQEATAWSLQPLSLINILFLDKEVDLNLFSGLQLFFGRDLPLFVSLYMGQISLVGFGSWVYSAARTERIVTSALLLVTVIVALGRYTPIYPFLVQHVPLFGFGRFPEKFFFLTYAILLFVVLKGLRSLCDHTHSSQKMPFLVPCLLLALLTACYLVFRMAPDAFTTLYRWMTVGPESVPVLKIFSSLVFSLERQIVLLSGILLLILLYKLKKIRGGIFRELLLIVVFVDLAAAHRPYQFSINPDVITQATGSLSNPDPEPVRLFTGLPHLHPSVFTFKARSFEQGTAGVFAALVPNTGILQGFEYMQEIDALSRRPYDVFLRVAKDLPPRELYALLGALNIKYVASFAPLPEGDLELVREFADQPVWLYQLNRPVPRVYVASSTRHEQDPVKTLELLASKGFDPFNEVVLEAPASFNGGTRFRAETEIMQYGNQTVVIRASLEGAGILVLTDSFYPGWRAYVNGVEQEILRANYFFRGVALPAGEHIVEFRYEPLSFKIGLAISLLTLALIGAVTLWRFLVNRRRPVLTALS